MKSPIICGFYALTTAFTLLAAPTPLLAATLPVPAPNAPYVEDACDADLRAEVTCEVDGSALHVEYAGGRSMTLYAPVWIQDGVVYRTPKLNEIHVGDAAIPLPIPNAQIEVNCSVFSMGIVAGDGLGDLEETLNEYLSESEVELTLPTTTLAAGFAWGDQLTEMGVPGPIHPCQGYLYFYFDAHAGVQMSVDQVSLDLSHDEMLVVLVDPADPAFFVGIQSDAMSTATQVLGGVGFGLSANGKLRWSSAVPLWSGGSHHFTQTIDGHLYTSTSMSLKPYPECPVSLDIDADTIFSFGDLPRDIALSIENAVLGARAAGEGFDFRDFREYFDDLSFGMNIQDAKINLGGVLNIKFARGSVSLDNGMLRFASCTPMLVASSLGIPLLVDCDEDFEIETTKLAQAESEPVDKLLTLLETAVNVNFQRVVEGYVDLTRDPDNPRFSVRTKASIDIGPCSVSGVWLVVSDDGFDIQRDDGKVLECDVLGWLDSMGEQLCELADSGLMACTSHLNERCSEIGTGETCENCVDSCKDKHGNSGFKFKMCKAFKCKVGCGVADGFAALGQRLCEVPAHICAMGITICSAAYPPAPETYDPTPLPLTSSFIAANPAAIPAGYLSADPEPLPLPEPTPTYGCKRVDVGAGIFRVCEEPLNHAEAVQACFQMNGVLAHANGLKVQNALRSAYPELDGLWVAPKNQCRALDESGLAPTACEQEHGYACLLAKANKKIGPLKCRIHGFGGQRYVHCDKLMGHPQAKSVCNAVGGHLVHLDTAAARSDAQSIVSGKTHAAFWTGLEAPIGYEYHWVSQRNGYRPLGQIDHFAPGEGDSLSPFEHRVAFAETPTQWFAARRSSAAAHPALCALYTGGDWSYSLPSETAELDLTAYNAVGDDYGQSMAAGDINGDGYDDLVVGAPNDLTSWFDAPGSLYVHLGSTTGLGAPIYIAAPAGSFDFGRRVEVGDIDADGRAELIATNRGGDELVVIDWTADTGFQAAELIDLTTEPLTNCPWGWCSAGWSTAPQEPTAPWNAATAATAVAVGDLTGDGRAELVVSAAGSLRAFSRPSGGAAFEEVLFDGLTGPGHAVDLEIGDLNGDGALDVAAAGGHGTNGLGAVFFADPGANAYVAELLESPAPSSLLNKGHEAATSVAITAGRVAFGRPKNGLQTTSLVAIYRVPTGNGGGAQPCDKPWGCSGSGGFGAGSDGTGSDGTSPGWGQGGSGPTPPGSGALVMETMVEKSVASFGRSLAGRDGVFVMGAPQGFQGKGNVFATNAGGDGSLVVVALDKAPLNGKRGVSVTLGDFDGSGVAVAAGAPGAHGSGRVVTPSQTLSQE